MLIWLELLECPAFDYAKKGSQIEISPVIATSDVPWVEWVSSLEDWLRSGEELRLDVDSDGYGWLDGISKSSFKLPWEVGELDESSSIASKTRL